MLGLMQQLGLIRAKAPGARSSSPASTRVASSVGWLAVDVPMKTNEIPTAKTSNADERPEPFLSRAWSE